jgi:hypothetical protein
VPRREQSQIQHWCMYIGAHFAPRRPLFCRSENSFKKIASGTCCGLSGGVTTINSSDLKRRRCKLYRSSTTRLSGELRLGNNAIFFKFNGRVYWMSWSDKANAQKKWADAEKVCRSVPELDVNVCLFVCLFVCLSVCL